MECTIDEIRQLIRSFIEKRLSHDPCSQDYVSLLVEKYLAEITYGSNNNLQTAENSSSSPRIERRGVI